MNIMITTKNDNYSNWTYTPLAFIAYHAVPKIISLMPRTVREKAHSFLATWEEHMLAEITYRKRTWFGLNGVDQYDLVADCAWKLSRQL